MAKKEDTEFFSEWHREQYIADLKREIEGYDRRIAEMKDLPEGGEWSVEQAESGKAAAQAELDRLQPKKRAPKKAAK